MLAFTLIERPRCFNRPDFSNYLLQDGWEPGVSPSGTPTKHPVMVEQPFTMSPGCKAWAGNPGSDPVPLAENWACEGCRHFPHADVKAAIKAREARSI